jgi:hypothetical protein
MNKLAGRVLKKHVVFLVVEIKAKKKVVASWLLCVLLSHKEFDEQKGAQKRYYCICLEK